MTSTSFAFTLMAAMVWLVGASFFYVKALATIDIANRWPTWTMVVSLAWPGVLLWVLIERMIEAFRNEPKP